MTLPDLPPKPVPRAKFLLADRRLRCEAAKLAGPLGVTIRPTHVCLSNGKFRFTGWRMAYRGIADDLRPGQDPEEVAKELKRTRKGVLA